MALLSDYEVQVKDLLHDPNSNIWTIQQIDRYINEARRRLVIDTGCLRTLQESYITQGQEQYTFGQVSGVAILNGGTGYTGTPTITFSGGGGSGVAATLTASGGAVNTITFTNFGSGYTSTPSYVISGTGTGATLDIGILSFNTYDVIGISPLWGSQRYPMQWRPFSVMSALLRQWTSTTYQRQPVMFSTYANTSLYIGPPPDQTYQVEFDSIILPTDLADYVTPDPIPLICQDPIQFYAAYRAKFNQQSFGEAETMLNEYRRLVFETSASPTRRIPDIYTAAG